MATVDYPTELPIPLQDGYSIQHVSPLMRTDLDSGRARQRRRFTSVPSNVSVNWFMTEGEAIVFEGFFKHTLLDGALWFNCPLRTPMGCKLYECRFVDIYDGPNLDNTYYWRFSATIEIKERQVIDSAWLEFPEFVTGSDIIDLAANQEWPKEQEWQ